MHKGLSKGLASGQVKGNSSGLLSGSTKGLFNEKYTGRNLLTVLIIGDSIADSAATEKVAVKKGTLFAFINGAVEAITGQSYANDSRDLNQYSGFMQHFAPLYKRTFGRPVYIISGAHGGSTVSNHVDPAQTWYTTGTLYTNFIRKAQTGLARIGNRKPDAIMITLGINDARAGNTYSEMLTGVTSLCDRLIVNFPGVPILIDQVGRHETETVDGTLVDIRHAWKFAAQTYTDVHIVSQAAPLAVQNGYRSDALHKNAYGYSIQAIQTVNWFRYAGMSKWGRMAACCLYDQQPASRLKLIENFVSSQVSNSNWFILEQLLIFKTSNPQNIEVDWAFLGFGVTRTATFIRNDCISTDGASTRFDTTFSPSRFTHSSALNDVISGLYIKTSNTTNAAQSFGVISTSGGTRVFSLANSATGAAPMIVRVNDNTTDTSGAELYPAAGNWYSIARTASNSKSIIKNTTASAVTRNSTGLVQNFPVYIGCVNNAGTPVAFFQGEFQAFYAAKYSTFDLSSFITELNTLLTNW